MCEGHLLWLGISLSSTLLIKTALLLQLPYARVSFLSSLGAYILIYFTSGGFHEGEIKYRPLGRPNTAGGCSQQTFWNLLLFFCLRILRFHILIEENRPKIRSTSVVLKTLTGVSDPLTLIDVSNSSRTKCLRCWRRK